MSLVLTGILKKKKLDLCKLRQLQGKNIIKRKNGCQLQNIGSRRKQLKKYSIRFLLIIPVVRVKSFDGFIYGAFKVINLKFAIA
jgi:hypothetical protein